MFKDFIGIIFCIVIFLKLVYNYIFLLIWMVIFYYLNKNNFIVVRLLGIRLIYIIVFMVIDI